MTDREYQVATLADIAEPGGREFRVGGGDWPFRGVVVRWEGAVYAYTNACAHLGHPLNFDSDRFFTLDMNLLLCASHGAVFEPATGLCVGGPCRGASLQQLPCRLENGCVFVTAPVTRQNR